MKTLQYTLNPQIHNQGYPVQLQNQYQQSPHSQANLKQLSKQDFKQFLNNQKHKYNIDNSKDSINENSQDKKLYPLKYPMRYSKIDEENGEDQESEHTQQSEKESHTRIQSAIYPQQVANKEKFKQQAPYYSETASTTPQIRNGTQPKQINAPGGQKQERKINYQQRKTSLPVLLIKDQRLKIDPPSPQYNSNYDPSRSGEAGSSFQGGSTNFSRKPFENERQAEEQNRIKNIYSKLSNNNSKSMKMISKRNNKSAQKRQNNSNNQNLLIGEAFDLKQEQGLGQALFNDIQVLKVQRNGFKQENNELKEKIVNAEKDIKTMQKQIEKWNLGHRITFDENELPFLDSYSVEKVYSDPNFYLVTLQKCVKVMQQKENEFTQQIQKYNEIMRIIRTDLKADENIVEIERELMHQHSLLLSGYETNEGRDEIVEVRDVYQEAIKSLREKNRTEIAEIRLQRETQSENDYEIQKLEKRAEIRNAKISHLKQLLINKSPEELQAQKKEQKEKTQKLEEEKKNALEMQNNQVQAQQEQMHNLQYQFQEFRREQIIKNQIEKEKYLSLSKQINEQRDLSLATIGSIAKKKKFLLKLQKENNKIPQAAPPSNQSSFRNLQQVGGEYLKEEIIEQQIKSLSQISEKPLFTPVQSINQFHNNPQQFQKEINLSIHSSHASAYGSSEKSKYENDESLSSISRSVLTVDI